MKTLLQLAGVAALAALAFFLLTASKAVVNVTKHVDQTLAETGDTLKKVNLELDEAHRLTLEAGLTAMEARKASVKESAFLDSLNAQVLTTTAAARTTLIAVQGTAEGVTQSENQLTLSTTHAIDALPPTLQAATLELGALHDATQHLDTLLADPALPATMSSIRDTSAHLDATSADVQGYVHSLTHPTIFHKIWNGALDVAHIFNPF